jgi:oxygen-independent coproporphyrinogen-3 oxidase
MSAGVYLHIPFCKSRCSYCDFATDVYRSNDAVERYVDALCREINESSGNPVATAPGSDKTPPAIQQLEAATQTTTPSAKRGHPSFERRGALEPIDTIYFGGGTPSLLTPKQLEKILDAVLEKFDIRDDLELTMEMNPATVTLETLKDYKSLGVNRASFGVQTFNDADLKRLARGHNAEDARQTFRLLRQAGFENVSFDLIIGLPGQTLADWEKNLDEALSMQPEHLSLYLLEVHQGTPLAEQIRSERQPMPDEELAAEMYELMLDKTSASGFAQYEISNFSRPGFESRHNTKYWRLDPVYGFGVSAHSFDGYQRYSNERDTAAYVRRVEEFGGAEIARERIDLASEFVFLGLRMTDGIDLEHYNGRFGTDLREKYRTELNDLVDSGLIAFSFDHLRLTSKGMLYSNEVFSVFV